MPSPRKSTANSITLTRAAGCFIASSERVSAGKRESAGRCSAQAAGASGSRGDSMGERTRAHWGVERVVIT